MNEGRKKEGRKEGWKNERRKERHFDGETPSAETQCRIERAETQNAEKPECGNMVKIAHECVFYSNITRNVHNGQNWV